MGHFSALTYLFSAVCFIMALKGLSSQKTARSGNLIGITGMVAAIIATYFLPGANHYMLSLIAIILGGSIGVFIALKIKMTALPQLVAGFHSFVGLAAVLIAFCAFLSPETFSIRGYDGIHVSSLIEMSIGAAIGAITFTGSLVAFAKLQGIMGSKPIRFPMMNIANFVLIGLIILSIIFFCKKESMFAFILINLLALILGFMLIIPIGGADMPVVVSMLNSYSGWAAAGIGFTLSNSLLIITGALVGASGAILSYIMCKAMNRSIFNVIFGNFAASSGAATEQDHTRHYNTGSAEDAAFLMTNASSVIIVPGYGMAVAQAQHAIKVLSEQLKKHHVDVKFAIHPVAGRMPGHMNVLLAEANIDYEDVFELEQINNDFKNTDVVLVIGANDITNPAAKNDQASPIFGMPILDVASARNIFFIKRSMASGYAGIENDLFYQNNCQMLFGDAKKVVEQIVSELENL